MKNFYTIFNFFRGIIFSLFFFFFVGAFSTLFAQNSIDAYKAATVAQYLIEQQFDSQSRGAALNLVFTAQTSKAQVAYYVFNVGHNEGFVIVSGNDIARPILGYSTQGYYDSENLPPNFVAWMDEIASAIGAAIDANMESSLKVQKEWEGYTNRDARSIMRKGGGTRAVAKLVQTTWNQSPLYNYYCPGGSVTGCVATAMAQVMKYHEHPLQGTGEYSYDCNFPSTVCSSNYGILSVNYGETTYNWASMPNAVNSSNYQEVAKLMYHCGVSVDMQYCPTESGAYSNYVGGSLVFFFDYDWSMRFEDRNYFTNPEWIALLKNEMDNGRPVYYSGARNNNGTYSGHAFVCDGYDNSNNFHFNWGWGGSNDGFYSIDAVGYNVNYQYKYSNQIYTGCKPNEGGELSPQIYLEYYTNLESPLTAVARETSFNVSGHFCNAGWMDFLGGDYAIGLYDVSDNLVSIIGNRYVSTALWPGDFFTNPFDIPCSVPATVTPGHYTMKAIVKETGSNVWGVARATIGYDWKLPLEVLASAQECTATTTSFNESFDATAFPPACWSNSTTTGTPWHRVTFGENSTCYPKSGAGMVKYSCWDFEGGTGLLITPELAQDGKERTLTFWMFRDWPEYIYEDKVNVYLSTTKTITGLTPVLTVHRDIEFSPAVNNTGWYQYTINIPATISSSVYVIFEGVSDWGYNIYMDDIAIVAKPLAVPTAAVPDNITTTGFTAKWSAVAGATNYKLSVFTKEGKGNIFVPGYEDLLTGNVTQYVVTGLTPNTQYYYTVKTVMGNGTSDPSSEVPVKTLPEAAPKVFTKITSLAQLTDGEYVVAYGSTQAMLNVQAGSGNTINIANTPISPVSDNITNPDPSIVWKIETDGSYKTIYNEDAGVYVSSNGGNNSALLITSVTNAARWTFSYSSNLFQVLNAAVSRYLRYNTGSPRFACYDTGQQNLTLYKYIPPVTDPVITAEPNPLAFGEVGFLSTSAPKTLTVTGANLTAGITYVLQGTDPGAFALVNTTGLPATGGTLNITFSPTEERPYSAILKLSSAGADDVNVTLTGTGTKHYIAKWNGYATMGTTSSYTWLANGGIPANNGIATLNRDAAGAGFAVNDDGVPVSTTWENAMSVEKYWITTFSTLGYDNLAFTSRQRGSNTGPKDFKVQYRVGTGGTWTDVPGATIVVANDAYLTGVLTDHPLPTALNNQAEVSLRWLCTSTNAINGSPVASTGVNRLDVVISGEPVSTFLPAPLATDETNVGSDAFTANWEPVTEAETYLLSVYKDASIVLAEDFDGLSGDNTTTTGSEKLWSPNSKFSYSDDLYEAGNAIKIDGYGDLYTKGLNLSGGPVTVSFDVKGLTVNNTDSRVMIDYTNNQQINYTALMNDEFEHVSFTFAPASTSSIVQISTYDGPIFIDNLKITVGAENITYVLEDENVGDVTSYNVESGLTPGELYFYNVKAKAGSDVSDASNDIMVQLGSPLFCGGNGTTTNPYLICTPQALDAVRYFLAENYKLTADIDLAEYLAPGGDGYAQWGDLGWEGIDDFAGVFDGDGFVVKNLKVKRTEGWYNSSGLFNYTYYATIRNLGVVNCNISSNAMSGALAAGAEYSVIENCYSTGVLNGNNNSYALGGLVSELYYATMENCYSTCYVDGDYGTGGLIGTTWRSTVKNCYATGNVVGNYSAGGLIGENDETLVINCYATGNVTADDAVGGITGANWGEIRNCVAANEILTASENKHGYFNRIVGDDESLDGTYSNNYAMAGMKLIIGTTEIFPADDANLNATAIDRATLTTPVFYTTGNNWNNNEAWDINQPTAVWQMCPAEYFPYFTYQTGFVCSGDYKIVAKSGNGGVITPAGTIQVMAGSSQQFTFYAVIDGLEVEKLLIDGINEPDSIAGGSYTFNDIDANHTIEVSFKYIGFCGGLGTGASPIQICTAEDLRNLAIAVNEGDYFSEYKHFVLTNDIDLSAYPNWEPIGTNDSYSKMFRGYFNGNGYKVTNLTINRPSQNYIGLFGVSVAEIQNMGVETGAAGVIGQNNVGALAGYNYYGDIENSYATGKVTGNYQVGGMVGFSYWNGSITNCYATTDVNGNTNVGGLVGQNYCVVDRSYATGTILGTDNVGGIAGSNSSIIQNSVAANPSINATGSNCFRITGYNNNYIFSSYANEAMLVKGAVASGNLGASAVNGASQSLTTLESLAFYNNDVDNIWEENDPWSIEYPNGVWAICDGETLPWLRWENRTCGTTIVNAQPPVITTQPQSASLEVAPTGGTHQLNVTATSPDGGTLSYQWYSNSTNANTGGTLLTDEEANLINVPRDVVGTYYYYVVVTNTIANNGDGGTKTASVTSNVVTITVFQRFCGGFGTQTEPYLICTAQDLADLAIWTNGGGSVTQSKYFKLMNDIDLDVAPYNTGAGWTPIGSYFLDSRFQGNFNGNEKVVKNLFINREDHQGLFGVIAAGKIYNLGIENCNITGTAYLGALAGEVFVFSSIENCFATGNISGTNRVGGLVGEHSQDLTNCYATCNVTGSGSYIGGLVGYNEFSISNCYATGAVSGKDYVGGLAGESISFIINSVAANPSVIATGGTNVNRITGSGGMLQNNYALETMVVTGNSSITPGLTTNAGANAPLASLNSFAFYNTNSNWNSTAYWSIDKQLNNEKVWRICDHAMLPILQWQIMEVACPFIIEATAGTHGAISPAGFTAVGPGATQAFTITPESCYEIDEVLVDNVATEDYSVTGGVGSYSFEDVDDNHTIHVVFKDAWVTPSFTFGATLDYCIDSNPVSLPSTSANGIAGTWSPATISTSAAGTATYTFTPTTGQCVIGTGIVTVSVTVSDNPTPHFNFGDTITYCQNAEPIDLPLTSTNSIEGVWSPATISTATAGTTIFTFTPGVSECADATVRLTVIVKENVSPYLALSEIGFCKGSEDVDELPAIDDNGVFGTWSPSSVIDTDADPAGNPYIYTFTPTAGQCLIDPEETIEAWIYIWDNVTPEFDFGETLTICQYAEIISWPTVSDNGIEGTWSPETINTSVPGTTTYTFTPNPEIDYCLIGTGVVTISVTIVEKITPTFNLASTYTYCQGATSAVSLPLTSTNGVDGTWSPSTISTATAGTTTYTFTPATGECVIGNGKVEISVTITEAVTPGFTFGSPISFCIDAVPVTLPLTSANGIEGTWLPTTINTATAGTTTYTFTPNAGACVIGTGIVEITVTVHDTPSPTFNFDLEQEYCQGATPINLPTTSFNGVAGTWLPATISTTTPTTTPASYIFTPSVCSDATAELTVTVIEKLTPVFTGIITNYIEGDPVSPLPLTSDNGIEGSWSPATITTDVASNINYTFTPNEGICAFTYMITISVKPPHYVINATAGAGGTITPAGVVDVMPGDDQNFTFEPNTGYTIVQLIVDGVNIPDSIPGGSYTFLEVDNHHNIMVTFKQIGSLCPDQLYDIANDITYNVVELVGLCWLKENLRNTKYSDGSDIPFAQPYYHAIYPDTEQNTTNFGLLYDWYSTMKVTRGEPVQGVCPAGWRLPTSTELVSMNAYPVDDLRNPIFWLTPNTNTNTTGMDIRAAGFYNSVLAQFEELYGYTAFWTSDAPAPDATTATAACINYYCNKVEIVDVKLPNAISVRCVLAIEE